MGINIVDTDGHILYLNQRLLDIFGYENIDELKASPLLEQYTLESYANWLVRHEKQSHGEPLPDKIEVDIVRKDGTIRHLQVLRRGVFWDGKQRYQTIYNDITERVQVEAALKVSENSFRNSLDNSPIGIRISDIDNRTFYANQALLDIFGYQNIDEVIVKSPQEYYSPKSYAEYLEMRDKYGRGEIIPDQVDIDIVHKDGAIRHLQALFKKVFWDGKQQYQTLYNDITERKQAEEALQENETRYHELVNTITSGVIIYKAVDNGEDFVFVDVNSAAEKLDRINREDIIGKKITEVLPGSRDYNLFKVFQNVWQTGNSKYYSSSWRKDESDPGKWRDNWTYKLPSGEIVNVYNDITDKKLAEEALKASEQNFRSSMESSFLGTYIVDSNWLPLYVNQALMDIFGYENIEAVRASPPAEHYTPESYADYLQRSERLSRSESNPDNFEIDIVRKDGAIRHLQVFRREVFWDAQQRLEVLYNDITELKQAEKALLESEEKYRLIVENSRDIIFTLDSAGKLLYISPSIRNVLGYNPTDLIGQPFLSVVHPEDLPAVAEAIQRNINVGAQTPSGIEFRARHSSGEWRWQNGKGTVVRDTNDNFINFIGVVRDITESKKVEEALRQNEEKYRLIVENSGDLIFTLNSAGEFIYVSPSVTKMLGYSQTELLGKRFRSLVHPDDLYVIDEAIQRNIVDREQTTGNDEYRFRNASGEWRWLISTGTPTREKDEHVFTFIGVARDITESKKAEEERHQLEEKSQVASRLAAMGEMAAGIAHEINNPLTGVLGYAQIMLARENIPEDIKGDLRLIADSSQRVAEIVKRLLTFTRQAKPVKSLVNLNELIDDTLKLRDYVLKTANIKVFTRFDQDLPLSVVDPGQLQQVFLNLIVNAEQAMREAHGNGTLTISTQKQDNNIRISFQDDGPGITEQNQAHLFEPFFTTKAPGEGTGLGLSLSRSIILAHNGNIHVESESGHGTTFIIELPIIEALPSVANVSNHTIKVKPAATRNGKVLVVDDELVVRGVLHRVLTRMGHSVDTIADARIAMEKIDAGAMYDVILTDVRMPGMSGIEMYTRIVEKIPAMKNRIIFITGDVMGADIKNFLTQNGLAFLAKPFDIESLEDKISTIFISSGLENNRPDGNVR